MITKSKSLGQLKEKSLSVLIKEADEVFSKYIRLKNSHDGACYCFVCGKWMHHVVAQNGHFIDRDQIMTRYDEMNCHPVCMECNVYDPNHREKYRKVMVFNYGEQNVKALEVASQSLAKLMRHELVELIEDYKSKVKELSK